MEQLYGGYSENVDRFYESVKFRTEVLKPESISGNRDDVVIFFCIKFSDNIQYFQLADTNTRPNYKERGESYRNYI